MKKISKKRNISILNSEIQNVEIDNQKISDKEIIYSFIVPVYNVENYLDECIKSLVSQKSIFKFEIILINDGSTDASGDIAAKYEKEYANVFLYNKVNGGLSSARNTGIKKASGRWLIFVDSDDFLERNFLKIIDNYILKLAVNDIIVVDNLLLYEDKSTYIEQGVKDVKRRTGCLINDVLPIACGKLISRKFFLKYKLSFPEGIYYEDMALFPVWASKVRNCYWINKPLYVYRQRQESISHDRNITKMGDVLKALDVSILGMQKTSTAKKICFEYFAIQFALTTICAEIVEVDYENELVRKIVSYMETNFPNYKNNKYLSKLSVRNRVYLALLSRHKYKELNQLIRVKKNIKELLNQKYLKGFYWLYKKSAI